MAPCGTGADLLTTRVHEDSESLSQTAAAPGVSRRDGASNLGSEARH